MEWQLEAVSSVFLETEYSDGMHRHCVSSRRIHPPLERIDTNSDALRDIREAAVDLAARRNEEEWNGRLLRLMNTSHARMNGAKSPIELNTLRKIYTDSCLLRGLSRSLSSHSTEAIAILDSAIIIAGPYGGGRHELLLDAIFKIQQPISTSTTIDIGPEPLGTLATYVQCTIPCLPTPPPFITFQNTFSYGPFILRNYAVHWPALQARPWRSCAYLRSVAGPGRIVPVEVGSDYRTHDWQQKIMPWDEFLALLDFQDQPASNVDPNVYYLAQHDLTRQFPGLRDDVIVPDYVYAQLKTPDFPSYHPPCNEDQILFNTWLGPKGTISPAHVVSNRFRRHKYVFTNINLGPVLQSIRWVKQFHVRIG